MTVDLFESDGRADRLEALRSDLRAARSLLILTGAGVSAESGVPTFRDAMEGEWARNRPEDLATPEAFQKDPDRVWKWYALRQARARACQPNPGHLAIARLQHRRRSVTVVTQNVDGLHQRAAKEVAPTASLEVFEIHGSLFRTRCIGCGLERVDPEPVDLQYGLPLCDACGGLLRPGVVWFGEALPDEVLHAAFQRAAAAEFCVVAGTSARVHPAASLPLETLRRGGRVVEVNPEPTPLSRMAEVCLRGPSGVWLPALFD